MKKYLLLNIILFLSAMMVLAQERSISGKVTDTDNVALPGVNVLVKGTSVGVVTDLDGNYTISITGDDAVLVFTFIGMATQEISVGNQTKLDVEMTEDVTQLSEVVVTGYQEIDRQNLTGSVSELGSDKIAQMPFASVDQALQGNIAGLNITGTSGTPGSVQDIIIRGRSTISAGRSPLWVIDGIPVDNSGMQRSTASSTISPLASLNPENIESITVLKDPGSIAPYGSRGVNGVIVVTTKKGKSKTEFNFNATTGWQNDATNGPEMLNADQRFELFLDAISNSYGSTFGFNRAEAENWYLNSGDGVDNFGSAYADWDANGRPSTRWQDILTNQNAPIQTYNFSAQSGNENMNYFASLGFHDQEATVVGSSFQRYTGTVNLNTQLSKNVHFSTANNVAYMEQDGLLEQSAYFSGPRTAKYFMTPLSGPYNDDGSLNLTSLLSNVRNPLWIAANDINLNQVSRVFSNNSVKVDLPVENLYFKSTIGIDWQLLNYKRYQNRTHGDADDVGGAAGVESLNRVNTVIQNAFGYDFNLNNDHNFNVQVIQEYTKGKNKTFESYGEGFAADGLTNVAQAGTITSGSSTFLDWSIAGYLGLLNYDYNGKYLFNASFRRDGNSRFAPGYEWGNFWSVGAGWNMHEESFMQGMSFVNQFKLRASYGKTGNANIGINAYQASLGFSADYDGSSAVFPDGFGSSGLEWEKANSLEVGADFSVLEDKISGSFNYYKRDTYDAHQNVPLSRTSGFNSVTQNVGELTNQGLEFELNATLVSTPDFTLSIGGNLGTNKNEVTKLALDGNGEEIVLTTGTRRTATGHQIYEWYMVSYAGVNPDNGVKFYYTDETKTAVTDNFGEAERVWQGKGAIPTLLAGVNLNAEYKGVYLYAQANYAGGHAVWEPWTRYTWGSDRFSYDLFNGMENLMDRWQQPGDVTDVPKMQYTIEPWRNYDRFLHDGDFVRLRNVTFGYRLPQSMINNFKLNGVNVFVRGVNLWTWVKDKDLEWDPEIEDEGFGGLQTPPVKSYIVGLNINF